MHKSEKDPSAGYVHLTGGPIPSIEELNRLFDKKIRSGELDGVEAGPKSLKYDDITDKQKIKPMGRCNVCNTVWIYSYAGSNVCPFCKSENTSSISYALSIEKLREFMRTADTHRAERLICRAQKILLTLGIKMEYEYINLEDD